MALPPAAVSLSFVVKIVKGWVLYEIGTRRTCRVGFNMPVD